MQRQVRWSTLVYVHRFIAILDKVTPKEVPDIIQSSRAIDLNDFEERYLKEFAARMRVIRHA